MDKDLKKYLKAKRIFRREAIIRLSERRVPANGSAAEPLTKDDIKDLADEAELMWAEVYQREQKDRSMGTRGVPLAPKARSQAS